MFMYRFYVFFYRWAYFLSSVICFSTKKAPQVYNFILVHNFYILSLDPEKIHPALFSTTFSLEKQYFDLKKTTKKKKMFKKLFPFIFPGTSVCVGCNSL
jgi:hypothetical protein